MRKLTTSEFVQKSQDIHGYQYDYTSTEYVNSKTKVKIICPEHGEFEQTPANHLTGYGCALCGFKNAGQYHKKDTQSFIVEAKVVHGDKYDYTKTVYVGAREKVIITCPAHGDFEQQASDHLHVDVACLKCSYDYRGESRRFTRDEFIKKSNATHNNKYDYSLVPDSFRSLSDNVTIICPIHGKFNQSATNHANVTGCPKCATKKISENFMKSIDDFLIDARKVHGDAYDYSNVEYAGAFENVKIICPKDGIFLQTPTSHLAGIGCPKCSRRGQGAPRNLTRALRGEFDDSKEAYVYVIAVTLPQISIPLFKIGSGTGSRIKTVVGSIKRVGGTCTVLSQVYFVSTGEAIVYEYLAHTQVRDFQFVVPPELKFPGHSEVFTKLPIFDELEADLTLISFRNGVRKKIHTIKE